MKSSSEKAKKTSENTKKTKEKVIIVSVVIAILALFALLLVLTLRSCNDYKEEGILASEAKAKTDYAEEYIKNNPFNVSVAVSTTSTDPSFSSQSSSVYLTVDGENYSYTEPRGDVDITHLFVDGVMYVNESFMGIITKEPISSAEKIAENYKKYVTDNGYNIKFTDYTSFNAVKSDGVTTITSIAYAKSAADKMNKELEKLIEAGSDLLSMRIDTERSTLTVTLDEQGRYTSVKVADVTVLTYKDGSKELIRSTYSRVYTYENAKLITPSDAGNYIGMTSGYKDVFGQSLTIKTEGSFTGAPDSTTKSLLSSMFGHNSLVKVDKNNCSYEVPYPADQSAFKNTVTFLGDKIYFYESYGDEVGRTYADVPAEEFDYWYSQYVIANYIPTLARGYNLIDVAVGEDGLITVVCSYISEDYFFNL